MPDCRTWVFGWCPRSQGLAMSNGGRRMAELTLRDRQYELRDELAASLERDLVGFESEEEVIGDAPATRYVAGILFAPELRIDELIDQVVEESEEGQFPDSAS